MECRNETHEFISKLSDEEFFDLLVKAGFLIDYNENDSRLEFHDTDSRYIKDLKKENAKLKKEIDKLCIAFEHNQQHGQKQIDSLSESYRHYRDLSREYEKVLSFYADEMNYVLWNSMILSKTEIERDRGKKASDALKLKLKE